jgi:CheY-like chemotaxis protein
MLRAVSRPRILLVDDSQTVLMVLEASLSADFDIDTAPDGASGLERARRLHPDLIVTDSLMPGLDGFGLVRALSDHPETRAIPVVVLTSEEIPEDVLAGAAVRPAAIVTKSMDVSPLVQAIHAALKTRS